MVKDVKEKGLEPYEAPKMMVYEMEIEGAILGGSGSVDKVDVLLGFDPLETEEEW